MALDKAIKSGKEHRKEYHGSKSFDPSCRNHGGCPWCEENRRHKFVVRERASAQALKEYFFEEDEETT